jgi:hypothetical protein
MPEDLVNIFISHAEADTSIAQALRDELEKINKDRIRCFLDTDTIKTGKSWQPVIDAALRLADWLICIYTGEQSEYCGYEIGVFSNANDISSGNKDSRLVCLHDIEPLPVVFTSHQNRKIFYLQKNKSPLSDLEENAREELFISAAPLAKFFSDMYAYKGLYSARDASESQRQLHTLAGQVKSVTKAFKDARAIDIQSNTPTQLGLQITIPAPPGSGAENFPPLESIPLDAEVTGTFESFALFGLMPALIVGPTSTQVHIPASTWGKIRESSGVPDRSTPPWILRLEKDMLDAANERALSIPEATFVNKSEMYRAILTRHIAYNNGLHRFEIIFVKTLPRLFLGKKHTSVLLAGIVLAARFRFAYIEEPERVAAKFSANLPHADFELNCRQLGYDLERYQDEAFEHGLLNPAELISVFGVGKKPFVEDILHTTAEYRKALLEKVVQQLQHNIVPLLELRSLS